MYRESKIKMERTKNGLIIQENALLKKIFVNLCVNIG